MNSDADGIVVFDAANCTSTEDADGVVSIWMPTKVNWSWNDEGSAEAIISVEDDLGVAVNQWTTAEMELVVENDIQLDGLAFGKKRAGNSSRWIGLEADSTSVSVVQFISKILN